MDDVIEQAVKRAITVMRENLDQQLTVNDIARAAMFSKFHFTRVFQRATGVSPGRFLSALRLEQAKHLLVSTSLNIAEISVRVGYNSVGTFSSRFSRSVGMSPTTYRRQAGFAPHIPTQPAPWFDQPSRARVHGNVWQPQASRQGFVFIGLFPQRVPEGLPVRCTILSEPGPYRFDFVPRGTWYLLAQSVTSDRATHTAEPDGTDQGISVATCGPLTVGPDAVVRTDLVLKPVRDVDPPVLLALLDARKLALARMNGEKPDSPASAPPPDGRYRVAPASGTARTAP